MSKPFSLLHATLKFSLLSVFLFCSACSVNPVTGEQQLLFSSVAEDINIGKAQYKPAQQAQGGQYTIDKTLSAYITKVGRKLAKVSDQPNLPYEFVVLNNSVPNAWALPSGKIAINRGLLTQLENEAQLAAVLSHEIVHAAARHGAQRMRDNLIVQAGIAGLGLGLQSNDYRDLVIGGASLGAKLTVAKYGRDHELESDYYGMKYMALAGYDLQGAIDLQRLFVKMSKSSSGNNDWIKGLFASHPPSQERVQENIKTAQMLQNTGGFIGRSEYQQAMAYMQSKLNAYEIADQAVQALNQKKLGKALSLVNQAIKIEGKEAQFRSLKGQIYQQQGKFDLALKSHNKAETLNPQQFSNYLKRAETQQSLGNNKAAIADYQDSMNLLPTSVAALNLGQLFQKAGNKQQAINYYSQVATSPGEIGRQANMNLARLEINDKPEKFLKVIHVQDPQGPLLATIENRSAVKIKKLSLVSYLYDTQGTLLKKASWQTKAAVNAGQRSRYYLVPVSDHLPANQTVKTTITRVTLEQP